MARGGRRSDVRALFAKLRKQYGGGLDPWSRGYRCALNDAERDFRRLEASKDELPDASDAQPN